MTYNPCFPVPSGILPPLSPVQPKHPRIRKTERGIHTHSLDFLSISQLCNPLFDCSPSSGGQTQGLVHVRLCTSCVLDIRSQSTVLQSFPPTIQTGASLAYVTVEQTVALNAAQGNNSVE